MRKLVASTFVSLDGVMQAPGGPREDDSGGFALGGWTVPHFDESVGAFMGELMGKPFDLVLGRRTYDVFAAHWPHASEADGAGPLNAAVKHVASRSGADLPWGPAQLLEGDVVAAVRATKEQDGPELQVHGSCELLQALLGAGLVDELRLVVFPWCWARASGCSAPAPRPPGCAWCRARCPGRASRCRCTSRPARCGPGASRSRRVRRGPRRRPPRRRPARRARAARAPRGTSRRARARRRRRPAARAPRRRAAPRTTRRRPAPSS